MNEVVEKKSKWGKVGKVSLIMLTVLLCVAGVLYSLTDVGKAASKYNANRDRAKKLGLVFDATDAAKLYPVSLQDNAYPEIKGPLETLSQLDDTSKDKKITNEEFLISWQIHSADFVALERACEKTHLIPNDKPIQAKEGATPHFVWMKAATRALMRRAELCADRGEVELGHRIFRTTAKFTVMVDNDPWLMATLVRLSLDGIITKEIKSILTYHGRDPRWQSILQEALTILDKPYDFKPWIKREHWSAIHFSNVLLGADQPERRANFDFDQTGQDDHDSIPMEFKLLRAVPRMRSASLSRLHEGFSVALEKYPSNVRDVFDVEKALKESNEYFNNDGLSFRVCFFLVNVGPAESLIRNTVNRNATMQALEILRRNLDPAKGLPLEGRFALDVDGKPLRLKHLQKGWIVYSVGKNKVDDGGQNQKYPDDDVPVHLSPGTVPKPLSTTGAGSKRP